MSFFGHIYRKNKLEYLANTAKSDGKKERGRQKQSCVASMKRRKVLSWINNKLYMIVNVSRNETWID